MLQGFRGRRGRETQTMKVTTTRMMMTTNNKPSYPPPLTVMPLPLILPTIPLTGRIATLRAVDAAAAAAAPLPIMGPPDWMEP